MSKLKRLDAMASVTIGELQRQLNEVREQTKVQHDEIKVMLITMASKLDRFDEKIDKIQISHATQEEKIKTIEENYKGLTTKTWGLIAGVLLAISGIIISFVFSHK